MLRKLVIISSVLFALTLGTSIVSAQNWENLGSRTVNDRADHDTWNVGAGKGEFRKIKLTVQRRAVRFIKLTVKFENGQTQDIELQNTIPAGGSTRVIDLVGTDRRIDKVDVWYEAQTVRRGARSQVTLHGMK